MNLTENIKHNLEQAKDLLLQYEKKSGNHHRLNIVLEQAMQAINRIDADEKLSTKTGKEYFAGHPTPETEITAIFTEEEAKPKKEIKKPKLKNDTTQNSWGKV